jgi:peptide/nickel transport system permease protein
MADVAPGFRVVDKDGAKRRPLLLELLTRLIKEKPLGTVGAAITLVLLFTGIFANVLAPHGMNEAFDGDYLLPPFGKYLLGTDNIGRDILSRIIFGARISVIVGLAGATISTTVATTLGIFCGYVGGRFDLIMQRFVDAMMSIPGIILLMVLISIIGPGMLQVIVILGVERGIVGSRVIRGATIGIKTNAYVEAAKAVGCPVGTILFRHILPNIMAPVIILFTSQAPAIILTEASLSFLGYGIPPPAPSWGGMLSGSGRKYMFIAPWIVFWPGLALSIVVYGVNMFGDALRDLLDPRLRGGVGRFGVKIKRTGSG